MADYKYDNKKMYSNARLLSYGKIWNFLLGVRGGGKSYNAKKWAINGFIKKREEFIYVRRYETELDSIATWFDDIRWEFPDHEFFIEADKFYIDKELAGQAIALSTSRSKKSVPFQNVTKFIFDEFLIHKGVHRYIKEEWSLWMDLYETVGRMRDIPALFIGNAVSANNPYFNELRIKPIVGQRFQRGDVWALEMYDGEEYINDKLNTQFGRYIAGSKYGNYAMKNEFFQDNDSFIEKMPAKCNYWMTIAYDGSDYGIWFSPKTGYLYVSKKIIHNYRNRYCFTTEDHNPNYVYLKTYAKAQPIKDLKSAYDIGYVRFDSTQAKQAFYGFMSLL